MIVPSNRYTTIERTLNSYFIYFMFVNLVDTWPLLLHLPSFGHSKIFSYPRSHSVDG